MHPDIVLDVAHNHGYMVKNHVLMHIKKTSGCAKRSKSIIVYILYQIKIKLPLNYKERVRTNT